MTKLVCIRCECELRASTSGTVVVEMASFGPYKVWNGDTFKCPGCGIEIVGGFAEEPMRDDHYASDFADWLKTIVTNARRLVYDNERPDINRRIKG